ncbi:MAG: GTP pyrophosphokinase family protein [Lachnospiraceae bacterium]|nr:GTP pyrophosphokinase family protein [Lachnospiraceae bacterium]
MGNSIYGNHINRMEEIVKNMQDRIAGLREKILNEQGMDPIEHYLARIKSDESMREKCRRNGLPETEESALKEIKDAIGIRIVCAFLDDVYIMRDYIIQMPDISVIQEKDYIRKAKPNGYRSYHMILQTFDGYYIEVQLRTISMDTWAALEHHMKYKKNLTCDTELIVAELKRCADELASTDVSMQAIKNLIMESESDENITS